MLETFIILLVGFGTGITTIMFGFGGGFVVVPFVFHVISGYSSISHEAMHIAVATSTAVMILTGSYATYINWRNNNLREETIFPLIYFIAIGALFGAAFSIALPDHYVRILFIVYLIVTIINCLFRKGFLEKTKVRSLSRLTLWFGGPIIGVISTALGVGGSVMTVPLLRRHGYDMKHCASAANPLSIPVAAIGAITYITLGLGKINAPLYIGYVNLKILGLLFIAGMAGIIFAKTFIPRVSDTFHARIYIILLTIVLVAMCL